ncbi:hypothetical protein [Hymenobacter crusticola]|uniref:Uncharacterized protein n=1 Tax=Hymenobacter crusticola TaxID=1770526 RepID=A0A243W4Z3_9BACT|nr:hypothetical protein [Hymenobacter crusticola]OUJ67766.1 hypothetical protein BXP70_28545 [Hymenobacter crusticola]
MQTLAFSWAYRLLAVLLLGFLLGLVMQCTWISPASTKRRAYRTLPAESRLDVLASLELDAGYYVHIAHLGQHSRKCRLLVHLGRPTTL